MGRTTIVKHKSAGVVPKTAGKMPREAEIKARATTGGKNPQTLIAARAAGKTQPMSRAALASVGKSMLVAGKSPKTTTKKVSSGRKRKGGDEEEEEQDDEADDEEPPQLDDDEEEVEKEDNGDDNDEEEVVVAAGSVAPAKKQKKRSKSGVKAMREIKKYQKSTEFLIRKLPMQRLVREIADVFNTAEGYRFQPNALEATHEAGEVFMVQLMEMAQMLAIHAKRITIYPKDIRAALAVLAYSGSELYMSIHTAINGGSKTHYTSFAARRQESKIANARKKEMQAAAYAIKMAERAKKQRAFEEAEEEKNGGSVVAQNSEEEEPEAEQA